jgi:xanthine dehydrogenase accessory factor
VSMDLLDIAHERSARGEPFVLATVVWRRAPSSGKMGSKALIAPDGTVTGWLGGACAEPAVAREALRALADGAPRLMLLGPAEELEGALREGVITVPIACQSEGALEVYVEPVLPRPLLVAIGRSPAAHAAAGLADALGWRSMLVAAEAELEQARAQIGPGAYVVVGTQGHFDEAALKFALACEPVYVGLVASRARAASVLDFLRGNGASEEALAQVLAPAGLDLGSTAADEIAVAILAEIVQLRASGAIFSAASVIAPSEDAIDPICGMAVAVETSRYHLTLSGTTYHFCSAGCRDRFASSAAATAET